jgi:ribosomal protein L40E
MMRLSKGAGFRQTQIIGLCGLLCLIVGVMAPLVCYRVQLPSPAEQYHADPMGVNQHQVNFAGMPAEFFAPRVDFIRASALTSPLPLDKTVAVALIILGVLNLLALLGSRLKYGMWLCVMVAVGVGFLFSHAALNIASSKDIIWHGLVPTRDRPHEFGGGSVIGWAFLPLLACPFLFWGAVRCLAQSSDQEKNPMSAAYITFGPSRMMGVLGMLLIVGGVIGPMRIEQGVVTRITSAWYMDQNDAANSFTAGYPTTSLLSSTDPVIKLGAVFLLVLSLACWVLLLRHRDEYLRWMAGAITLVVLFLLAKTAFEIMDWEYVGWKVVLPVYYQYQDGQSSAHLIIRWAAFSLAIAPALLWLAACWESTPFAVSRQLSRGQSKIASAQPADVGACSACGAKNSTRATKCHACGATLPWEAVRLEQAKRAAQALAASKAQAAKVAIAQGQDLGDMLYAGLTNFAVFWVCAPPVLGYFLWRYLDSQDSKYSGAAFCGWIFGAVLIGGGFLLRLLLAMSSVGAMK